MQANDEYKTQGNGDLLAMGRKTLWGEHTGFPHGSVLIIKLVEDTGCFYSYAL